MSDAPGPKPPALPARDFKRGGRRAQPAGDRLPNGRSKATAERKRLFLDLFKQAGSIAAACAALGFNRRRVAEWKQSDPAFAEEFANANEFVLGKLETEAYRRAVEGEPEPIVSGGKVLGERRVRSDSLLKTLMAARDPASYAKPGAQVNVSTGGPVTFALFDQAGEPINDAARSRRPGRVAGAERFTLNVFGDGSDAAQVIDGEAEPEGGGEAAGYTTSAS